MKYWKIATILISIMLAYPVLAADPQEYVGYNRVTIPYDNSTFFVPANANDIKFITSTDAPDQANYKTAMLLEVAPGNTIFYVVNKSDDRPYVYTYQYSKETTQPAATSAGKSFIDSILEAIGYGSE